MTKNILIIRLSSLGDIILTSPFVINTSINYPDAKITYLTKQKFLPVVKMIPGIDEVVTIDDNISFFKYLSLLHKLKQTKFDIIFDIHGNFRSWWAKKIIKAENYFTYPKRRAEREQIVQAKKTDSVYPHTIDLYNNALRKASEKVFADRPLLKVEAVELDENINKFISDEKFVVIAPEAAHPTKAWDYEKFIDTAINLHKTENVNIVWAITKKVDLSKLKDSIAESSLLILNNYPIDKLALVIEKASLTIANDSGVAHLSSAVSTPVLALFGPTHPALGFSPRGLFDEIIQVDEECRPCSLHGAKECYRDKRYCFDRIDPSVVINRARYKIANGYKKEKAVFVDRDGTIIVDKHFLSDPDQIEFEKGAVEGLKILQNIGYKIIIVSNQSGVARGIFDTRTVEILNSRLSEMLAKEHILIDAIYYCPHHPEGEQHPYNIECFCRKPAGGMVYEAVYQFIIDLRNSYVIGDKLDDMNLAAVTGANGIMVKTGYGLKQESRLKANLLLSSTEVAENLLEAARIIEQKTV